MLYLPQHHETNLLAPYGLEELPPGDPDGHGDGTSHVGLPDGTAEEEAIDHEAQILLVGDDETLQYSRRKILEGAGYTVRSVRSDVVVEELFLRGIELVLLCHTVTEDRVSRIRASLMRLAPQIPVLLISSLASLANPRGDRGEPATVPARPAALLGAVATKLGHH